MAKFRKCLPYLYYETPDTVRILNSHRFEPIVENTLLWSESLSNSVWFKSSATVEAYTEPSPIGNAAQVITLGDGFIYQDSPLAVAGGTFGGHRVWLKFVGGTASALMGLRTLGGSTRQQNVDITVTNDWQEFVISGAVAGTASRFLLDNRSTSFYSGLTRQLAVWRPQQWRGAADKQYVKTEGSIIQSA